MGYGVLIPAYQPDEKLLALADELAAAGLETVVVNDGSTEGEEVFAALREKPRVTVLEYHPNAGKGHALKLGLRHMMERGFTGAVTADADGQHTVSDIRRIGAALETQPGRLILGMRDVTKMPARSRAGNTITRTLFRLMYGVRLRDTQTGLRGIPLTGEGARGLLELEGERYEYEMEMLISQPRLFPDGVTEVPIETLYLDNNASTHFQTIRDGRRVYAVLFRNLPGFMASSLVAFGVDYLLFNLIYYHLFHHSVAATWLARAVSGTVNFLVNRRFVFHGKGEYTFLNYWKLALVLVAVNSLLMHLLVERLGLPAFLMKIIVECLMYVVSFTVQNKLASREKK